MTNAPFTRSQKALVPPEVCSTLGIKRDVLLPSVLAAGVSEPLDVETCLSWCDNPHSAPSWFTETILADEVDKSLRGVQVKRQSHKSKNPVSRRPSENTYRAAIDKLRSGHKLSSDEEYSIEILAMDLSKDLARGLDPSEVDADGRAILSRHGINPDDHSTWIVHAGRCRGDYGRSCAEYEDMERAQQTQEAERAKQVRRQWSDENTALMSSGEFEVGQTVLCWGSTIGIIVKKNKVTAKVDLLGKGSESGTVTSTNIKAHFLVPVDASPAEEGATIRFISTDGRERDGEVLEVDRIFTKVRYYIANGAERINWIDPSRLRGDDMVTLPKGKTSSVTNDGEVVTSGAIPSSSQFTSTSVQTKEVDPDTQRERTVSSPLGEIPAINVRRTRVGERSGRRGARRPSGPPQ